MAGLGVGLTVTLYVAVVTVQPEAVIVSPTINVPVPEAPQVTVTLFVPAPAVIAPPEIVHTYVSPPTFAVLYTTPDWFEHTVAAPLITGAGFELIVTLKLDV